MVAHCKYFGGMYVNALMIKKYVEASMQEENVETFLKLSMHAALNYYDYLSGFL